MSTVTTRSLADNSLHVTPFSPFFALINELEGGQSYTYLCVLINFIEILYKSILIVWR